MRNKDPGMIDDLIRAYSVESNKRVKNAYSRNLPKLTKEKRKRKGAWKKWFNGQVSNNKLVIDYYPIDTKKVDVRHQTEIAPWALQLGRENFEEMKKILSNQRYEKHKYIEALRYMIANDNLPEVREFFKSNWLQNPLAHRKININIIVCFLNSLANPGEIRDAINSQIRCCLQMENPIIVENALQILAVKEDYTTVFTVPNVKKLVENHISNPVTEVSIQAQCALKEIDPNSSLLSQITGSSIALLYHKDSKIRIRTIEAYSKTKDYSLIDDLIRAYSVFSGDRIYYRTLVKLTNEKGKNIGAWKKWLNDQVLNNKLVIDYYPIDTNKIASIYQSEITPWALRLGQEHFEEMKKVLYKGKIERTKYINALRYMIANDNLPEVRDFLKSNWLQNLFLHKNIDIYIINIIASFLNNFGSFSCLRKDQC